MKRYDATSIIHALIGLVMAAFAALLVALLINDIFADKTVLETFPGTRVICVAQRYDYSVKHTVCTQQKTIPAKCTRTQSIGPIFEPTISTSCK